MYAIMYFSVIEMETCADVKTVDLYVQVKDDWVQRLEDSVREWAAQIVLALEHLHNHGIICRYALSCGLYQ